MVRPGDSGDPLRFLRNRGRAERMFDDDGIAGRLLRRGHIRRDHRQEKHECRNEAAERAKHGEALKGSKVDLNSQLQMPPSSPGKKCCRNSGEISGVLYKTAKSYNTGQTFSSYWALREWAVKTAIGASRSGTYQ
ncbi:hypothetical protein D3C86_1718890 [compost metagenome]